MLAGLDLKELMSSGLSAQNANDSTPPDLPGYEITEVIGQGGMGTVFLANQQSLDRLVAVKVLSVGGEQRDLLIDRLEREARVMAKLHHRNLVAVYDFLKLENDRAAIVMELVDGGTLRERYLSPGSPVVSVDEVISIGSQVAACLEAAHAVGIVHRDIKPENLLLDRDGVVRVSDFGLALDGESMRLTLSGTSVGTLGYSAPEQLEGASSDERADVYSLGVVLYELLTKRKPMGDLKRPRDLRKDVPEWLERVILDALQPDQSQRVANAGELKLRLQSGVSGPSRRWWLAAAAVPVLAGIGLGWQFFGSDSSPQMEPLEFSQSNIIRGQWRPTEGGSYTSGSLRCLLGVSTESVVGKTVRVDFTRLSGNYPVAIFFRHPNGFGTALLGAYFRNLGGFEVVDGVPLSRSLDTFPLKLKNGQRYRFEVQIEADRIAISVDGEMRLEFPLAGQQLGVAEGWEWLDPEAGEFDLVIGSFNNPTIFHEVIVF